VASLPVYSHPEAVTGTVIFLGFYIAVAAAIALGWWRQTQSKHRTQRIRGVSKPK
jgi:hypothetical protein